MILISKLTLSKEIAPKNGLIGFYPFNGNVIDSCQIQKKGKILNAKLSKDRKRKAGGAWEFNSSKMSYIDLPIDISTEKYPILTIVVWLKPYVSSSYKPIITAGNYKKDRALFMITQDYIWHWAVQCGKDNELVGPPVIANNWTFIAIMYDQKNQEAKVIINDKLFSSRAKTGPGGKNVIIGQFDGAIDEIKFFNRFLTLNELETLYGNKINANDDQLKVIERYGYKDKIRKREKASVRLNDKFIIDTKEFVIYDTINSENYIAALTMGDTVIVNAIDNEKEWIQLKFQNNKYGWTNKGYLEENAYKEGSSRIIHWIETKFSNYIGNRPFPAVSIRKQFYVPL